MRQLIDLGKTSCFALAALTLAQVFAAAEIGAAQAGAEDSTDIAPHRAYYTMKLALESPPGAIVDGRGVLVFEWAESCESWEIQQRMAIELIDKNGHDFSIDATFASTESKDGLRYRFNTRNKHNGEVDKDLRGNGTLAAAGAGGEVLFARPEGAKMALPRGTIFPTEHVLLLLKAARAGQKHVTRIVYDGDNIDTPYEISAAIGRRLAAPEAPVMKPLADQAFWRIRLAYFPVHGGAQEPETEIDIDLQDNGVARRLKLDYGEYILDVTLNRIETLPRPEC